MRRSSRQCGALDDERRRRAGAIIAGDLEGRIGPHHHQHSQTLAAASLAAAAATASERSDPGQPHWWCEAQRRAGGRLEEARSASGERRTLGVLRRFLFLNPSPHTPSFVLDTRPSNHRPKAILGLERSETIGAK